MLDFDAGQTVILDIREAFLTAVKIVDASVGTPGFDGGRMSLERGRVQIQMMHTFVSQSAGSRAMNGSYTRLADNSKRSHRQPAAIRIPATDLVQVKAEFNVVIEARYVPDTMRQFDRPDFAFTVTALFLLTIKLISAVPLNLTESSHDPYCYPSLAPRHPLLDYDECSELIDRFRFMHLSPQYTLVHDPDFSAPHTILCPYWLFYGECAFMIDFVSGNVEAMVPARTAQEAMRVVDNCVGRPDVDGGAIYLANEKIQLLVVHAAGQSVTNHSIGGSCVQPATGTNEKGGSNTTTY
ncbi:MAG: hypothetical protein Q9217_005358 [Psora testacea]